MSAGSHTLRWGILGAGNISETFVKDLLIDPKTRGVTDTVHRVIAVGSRSVQKAQEFIERIHGLNEDDVKAYGSYQDLASDADVDVIYIGTPHSSHYSDVKLCLSLQKHVLCEKPMTVNASQARELFRTAKEKKRFLMEALWTRFLPITYSLQKVIASGEIGEIQRVDADFSINFDCDSLPPDYRLVNPELAGGALLDLGPYTWTMLALTLLHQYIKPKSSSFSNREAPVDGLDPPKPTLALPKTKASGVLYTHPQAHSGGAHPIDGSVMATLEFSTPSGRIAQGLFVTSIFQTTAADRSVMIYGNKGRIRIPFPACCPTEFGVTTYKEGCGIGLWNLAHDQDTSEKIHSFSIPGDAKGYMWQADEVSRCVKAGSLESNRMPHAETILMMEVFDEIRKQIGVEYPKSVESLAY